MENKDKEVINIGDLVKLKINNISKNKYKLFGFGIVLDKIMKLYILQNILPFHESENVVYKDTVETKIYKIYWFENNKTNWEYEDDIEIVEVKTSDS